MERTKGHILADVRFAAEYGSLNERFWLHVDTTVSLLQIAAGCFALAGAFVSPPVTAAAGIVIAALSAVQLGLRPRERAYQFREARRKFIELDAHASQLDDAELDAKRRLLIAEAPQGLRALSNPAHNIVNQRHGYPALMQLTLPERLALLAA
jgi:hypothetical protein